MWLPHAKEPGWQQHTFHNLVHIQGKHLLLRSLALSFCSGVGGAAAEASCLQIFAAVLARHVPRLGRQVQVSQRLHLYL